MEVAPSFIERAAQYGLAGLFALALLFLLYLIGRRMLASIDRLTERSDANAKQAQDKMTETTKEIAEKLGETSRALSQAMSESARLNSQALMMSTREIANAVQSAQKASTERMHDLSERIARVEARIGFDDDEPTPVGKQGIPRMPKAHY